MSDTPRTDALMDSIAHTEHGITSIPLERAGEIECFARQLERDLAAANGREQGKQMVIAQLEAQLAERDAEIAKHRIDVRVVDTEEQAAMKANIERQQARMAVLESVTRELLSYVEADYVGSRGKDYSNGAIGRARAALEVKE